MGSAGVRGGPQQEPASPSQGMAYRGRGVLEERGHSPFQVLDASAIEGIRGLADESSSAVYRYIRPPPPPPPPPPLAYRGATEGPGPPSYVGSSEERPCPDLGLCAPPSAPAGAGAAVGGWAPPPPDGYTCRVKPRLKSPPPPAGRQTGGRTPVLRGAPLTVCPTRCPAPRVALPRSCACPARPRREGGGAAPRRGGRGTTLSLTLALSLTPLTQSSSLWLPLCLYHIMTCSTLLPQTLPCSILLPLIAEGWGGTWTLPSPKPPCSPLLLAIPGCRWFTLCPICPRRINERGRDGAKNVRKARAPPSLPPAPAAGRAHSWRGGGGGGQ